MTTPYGFIKGKGKKEKGKGKGKDEHTELLNQVLALHDELLVELALTAEGPAAAAEDLTAGDHWLLQQQRTAAQQQMRADMFSDLIANLKGLSKGKGKDKDGKGKGKDKDKSKGILLHDLPSPSSEAWARQMGPDPRGP